MFGTPPKRFINRQSCLSGLLLLSVALAVPGHAETSGQEADIPAGEQAMAELAALGESSGAESARALPSLPRLFQRSLEYDADLSRQRFEVEATREEVPLARSQLLPQVTASGGYLWQDSTNIQTELDPDVPPEQQNVRPGEINEHHWQVQVQQPLFSLERWRGMDRARAQVSVSELQLAVAESDLALQVAEAYVNAYLASRRLGLLEAQKESLELQVRQAQRAYDLGVGDRINLLEARSRLDQAISDAVMAENELGNALTLLERLTGELPDFSGFQLGDVVSASVQQDWGDIEDWLKRTANNPRVRLAREQQRVNQADSSMRRGGYFPEVNLNLSYSDRESDDELRSSEDYRASVELSVPLYRGGFTSASVRQADLNARAAEEGVAHELNLAGQEVRQRIRSLNGSVRQLQALGESVASSELFLQAAERGEQLGLRDLVDVLDARASLYDQRIRYVDTIGRYVLDQLALKAAVGELRSDDMQQAMQLLASITDTAD
ncbi:TolC family outer membrane protein [Halomonas campisalis]|uniref:TolC family outer membrane protein n=1 Tax=Billgrantia campisalis TaxID=74661 RepID=A0ABS9P972_9GAMM|nr:TolC family outer membrane protein [Halomonas campisalis]MCG6658034.1 TolC family outer membrane protein [Halomonas campisalis]MDR5862701.1 TolC family outer membrane protein [Halomonas campisalis]